MGCGESKHAVATENTLTKSKSKSRSKKVENNPPVEKPTTEGNGKGQENEVPDAVIKKEEEFQADKGKESGNAEEELKENAKKTDEKEKGIGGDDDGNGEGQVEEKKEESKSEELKGEKKDEVGIDQKKEEEKVVSNDSDNHEETIESKIISGKVEGNDSLVGKLEVDGKAESNEDKEEGLKVDEGKKEVPADETKSCATTGEEKIAPAAENIEKEEEKEKANDATTTDVKAN